MTNGASNVIKYIQLANDSKPSGLVWVHFDHDDVGRKAQQENTQEDYQILGLQLSQLQCNLL